MTPNMFLLSGTLSFNSLSIFIHFPFFTAFFLVQKNDCAGASTTVLDSLQHGPRKKRRAEKNPTRREKPDTEVSIIPEIARRK